MKTLLLSPHLDDAALSAGQFLANQPGCDVLTVFSGIPQWSRSVVTPYDEKSGFTSSRQAVEARRREDRDALARLRCEPQYWDDYLDAQYGYEYTVAALADALTRFITDGEYELVLGPLGVRHPDHVLLGDALVAAAPTITAPVYLWEDLPNRVLYPEEVHDRLEGLNTCSEVPGGAGPMADKVRALLCYRSQLGTGDLDFNLLLVPERFHRLVKDGDES